MIFCNTFLFPRSFSLKLVELNEDENDKRWKCPTDDDLITNDNDISIHIKQYTYNKLNMWWKKQTNWLSINFYQISFSFLGGK